MKELNIDFPKIEGMSERQIEYAEWLRKKYVEKHIDRFKEIEEIVQLYVDGRILNDDVDDEESPNMCYEEFTEKEKACLFGINAGGIIATLKEW